MDDDFDALEQTRDGLFGRPAVPPSSSAQGRAGEAAGAISALADEHVLGALAAGDIAMTLAKLLAMCPRCGSRPPVPAVAFDRDVRWFDVSTDLCSACFMHRAVHLHDEQPVGVNVAGEDTRRQINNAVQRGGLRAWRVGSVECRKVLRDPLVDDEDDDGVTYAVVFSPDGMTIAAGTDGTVRLWDAESGARRQVVAGHTDDVMAVAYSPDGATVVTGGRGGDDTTVRLWNVTSGDCRRVLRGFSDGVRCVAYSPGGSTIAAGSYDNTARLWDASSGECGLVLTGHAGSVNAVTFSPEGSMIATCGTDSVVRLWDALSGECRRVLRGHKRWIFNVAFSPDGIQVATGSFDETVRLWDAASGECRCVLQHAGTVFELAFSPDGATIATGCDDGTMQEWLMASGQSLRTRHAHADQLFAIRYSADGSTIATGCGPTVRLWDAALVNQPQAL